MEKDSTGAGVSYWFDGEKPRRPDLVIPASVKMAAGNAEGPDQPMLIEGYMYQWGYLVLDSFVIGREALTAAIPRFMEFPVLNARHDELTAWPVGRVLEMWSDDYGLGYRAMVSAAERDLQVKLREDVVKAGSMGIEITGGEWNEELERLDVTDVTLFEFSLVGRPQVRSALFRVLQGDFLGADGQIDKAALKAKFSGGDATAPRELAGSPASGIPVEAAALLSAQLGKVVTETVKAAVEFNLR